MEEHSLSKRPSSLLLNDLQSDPDSFGAHPEQLIYQLMLLSLLYEEILIPDETIVLSDKITQWLSSPAGFNQWTQLLDLGSITFLLHPTRAYDERDNELRDLSEKHPFLARAKHLQGRATKHGAEFRLDESLSSVLHKIDEHIVLNAGQQGLRPDQVDRSRGRIRSLAREAGAKRPDIRVMEEFHKTLIRTIFSKSLAEWRSEAFPSLVTSEINPTLEDFGNLVIDPSSIARERLKKGLPTKITVSGQFDRSLATQAAKLFPEHELKLIDLIQSAFAAPNCWRENAVGRYGNNLRPIPMGPTSLAQATSTATSPPEDCYIEGEIIAPLSIPLASSSDFATCIKEVRSLKCCVDLRSAIASVSSPETYTKSKDLWSQVSDELAKRINEKIGVSRSVISTAFKSNKALEWSMPAIGIIPGYYLESALPTVGALIKGAIPSGAIGFLLGAYAGKIAKDSLLVVGDAIVNLTASPYYAVRQAAISQYINSSRTDSCVWTTEQAFGSDEVVGI